MVVDDEYVLLVKRWESDNCRILWECNDTTNINNAQATERRK